MPCMAVVIGIFIALWAWMLIEFLFHGTHDDLWEWVVLIGPLGGLLYFFGFYLPRIRRESPKLQGRKRLKELEALQRGGLTIDQCRELADLYRDRAQWAEALTYYQQALKGFPDNQSTRLEFAQCLIALNRVPEAASELEKVADGDVFYREQASLLLAQSLMTIGARDRALARLTPLYHPTSSPELKYIYAECLEGNGHRGEARAVLKELLSSAPLLSRRGQEWVRSAKQFLKKLV